jgi:hypothetical protein
MTLVWKYSEAPFTSSQTVRLFLLQRRPVSFTRSFFLKKQNYIDEVNALSRDGHRLIGGSAPRRRSPTFHRSCRLWQGKRRARSGDGQEADKCDYVSIYFCFLCTIFCQNKSTVQISVLRPNQLYKSEKKIRLTSYVDPTNQYFNEQSLVLRRCRRLSLICLPPSFGRAAHQ